jgi:hypothetical protein
MITEAVDDLDEGLEEEADEEVETVIKQILDGSFGKMPSAPV